MRKSNVLTPFCRPLDMAFTLRYGERPFLVVGESRTEIANTHIRCPVAVPSEPHMPRPRYSASLIVQSAHCFSLPLVYGLGLRAARSKSRPMVVVFDSAEVRGMCWDGGGLTSRSATLGQLAGSVQINSIS